MRDQSRHWTSAATSAGVEGARNGGGAAGGLHGQSGKKDQYRGSLAQIRTCGRDGFMREREPVEPFAGQVVTPLDQRRKIMGTIIIVILVLILIGALPTWGHSRNWGYGPSGLLGTVLVIVIILVLLHYI
jgi:hypothetical protein